MRLLAALNAVLVSGAIVSVPLLLAFQIWPALMPAANSEGALVFVVVGAVFALGASLPGESLFGVRVRSLLTFCRVALLAAAANAAIQMLLLWVATQAGAGPVRGDSLARPVVATCILGWVLIGGVAAIGFRNLFPRAIANLLESPVYWLWRFVPTKRNRRLRRRERARAEKEAAVQRQG